MKKNKKISKSQENFADDLFGFLQGIVDCEGDFSKPCEFVIHNGILEEIKYLIGKTELVIPEGVVKFDDNMLDVVETMDLERIIFPSTLEDIGERNFEDIRNLKEVVVNSHFKLEDSCLYSCDYKTLYFCIKDKDGELTVNKNCKEIKPFAFVDCEKLKKVILPPKMERIGEGAFWNCRNLKEINLPNYVENFEREIFANCYMLERVNLPENLTKIYAFLLSCTRKLKELKIPNSIQEIEDGGDEFSVFIPRDTTLILDKQNFIVEQYAQKYSLNIKYIS